MKTKLFLFALIGIFALANTAIAQTFYYNTTKSFAENGYTYQCDVEPSTMVRLYNKDNVYTYKDMYYNDGSGVYRYNGKNSTMEKDNWTKAKCNSIINNAFSTEQKKRIRNEGLGVTMIISPQTGKIIEVNFNFLKDDSLATIPISIYRQIELKLKSEVWFKPTTEGKKLNYIMRGWIHKIE